MTMSDWVIHKLLHHFIDANLRTEMNHGTARAIRLARETDLPAVKDHLMTEGRPVLFRYQTHQVMFNLHGIGMQGKAETSAQTADMCIDRYAGDFETFSQDYIRGLATDSGESDQLVEISRHLAIVLFNQYTAGFLDAFRLVAKETGGLNHSLKVLRIGPCEVEGALVFREQLRRYHVHAYVRALSR